LSEESHSPIWKGAGAVGAATLISRLLGLVRVQAFAILFGASSATDAFNVAFRIPNLFRNLLAEGALSAALVPTFTRARMESGPRRAWRLANLVFSILFIGVGILAIGGVCFAPQIVRIYAGAFRQIPGKFELTTILTRVMFPYFPFVTLAAAFTGVLNACGFFFLPALSAAIFNLSSILVGVALSLILMRHPHYGISPIVGMAFGVLAGGFCQALCQVPLLFRAGFSFSGGRKADETFEPLWFRDPALRQMLGLMAPGVIGLAATQASILVNTLLATSQREGSVSWLEYAFRLMQFPIGLFGASIASATAPVVARQWVGGDVVGVRDTLTKSLKAVFAMNLPASAGLAFLGVPIVELLFQYGRFYPDATQATALALAMYAVGLTAYSMVKLLVPACYALGNARVPVLASVGCLLLTVVLNVIMIGPFGYWGLALGTSIGAIANSLILVIFIRGRIEAQGVDFRLADLVRSFLAQLGLALFMGGAAYATYLGLLKWAPDRLFIELFEHFLGKMTLPVARGVKVGLLIAESMVVIAVTARVLRIRDTTEALDFFSRKLKKKLRWFRT